jgi:hypothetical protein
MIRYFILKLNLPLLDNSLIGKREILVASSLQHSADGKIKNGLSITDESEIS